ncbi:MAG: hypothetical protein M1830_004131 [Pleopsidium flavum]|nr:MAG: hypothetical protein M1830_004131 [Pleopsidium flavum]
MSAATAQGINLGEQFKMDDLWELLEADGCPQPLVKAVIRQLVVEEVDLVNGWMCADRNKSVRWVGATMLEAQGQVSTPVSEFQEAWKNELPEQWRISATLDALKGLFTQPTSTTIRFAVDGSQSTISTASLASARSGSGKAVRKWHEKFKNTRQ